MTAPSVNMVADWFLSRVDREAGDAITHLKLQKLLYFAQAWYLANKGKPLFAAKFQAWAHGPVVREIYDRFKGQGWAGLEAPEQPPKLGKATVDYLEQVFGIYGKFGAKHLEELTHQHAPWVEARGGIDPAARCETVISEESMRDYYGKKIGKTW
jgi:uncharacterized phage-associated protein